MARYQSAIPFQGSIGNITFTADGTAKLKTGLTKKKWKTMPSMRRARACAYNFGGASSAASALYRGLTPEMRRLTRRHAHSHLTAALRQSDTPQYTFEQALTALHRLQLGPKSPSSKAIHITTQGHPLNPEALQIAGLQQILNKASQAIGKPVRARIHLSFAEFEESKFYPQGNYWVPENTAHTTELTPSGWLYAQDIEAQGLQIPVQNPRPDQSQVLWAAIEYQICPRASRSTKAQPESAALPAATVCVAALFRSADTLALPIPIEMQPKTKRHFQRKATQHPQRKRAAMKPALRRRLATPPIPSQESPSPQPRQAQPTGWSKPNKARIKPAEKPIQESGTRPQSKSQPAKDTGGVPRS